MDNPNFGITNSTLRRHNSAPSVIRRRYHRHRNFQKNLSPFKSNPYVGWFRYAPTSSTSSKTKILASEQTERFFSPPRTSFREKHAKTPTSVIRTSPYVGWFRHAPPSAGQNFLHRHYKRDVFSESFSSLRKFLLLLELCHGIRNKAEFSNDEVDGFAAMQLTDWLSGHLKGGARESLSVNATPERQQSIHSLSRILQEHSMESTSATVKVLTRLASWFLYPFELDYNELEDQQQHIFCRFDNERDGNASECTSRNDDDGEVDSIAGAAGNSTGVEHTFDDNDPHESSSSMFSISSQAEAYYAHQASKELLDGTEYVEEEAIGRDRLDYVITQMDILRMNRNASRHLDVESICKLPVFTYEETEEEDKDAPLASIQKQQQEPAEMSWMMVQRQGLEVNDEEDRNRNEKNTNAPSDRTLNTRDENICVICLTKFRPGDRLRLLPCNHSFHVGCIDRWLSGSHSFDECYTSGCPTCKKRADDDSQENQTCRSSSHLAMATQPQGDVDAGYVPSWAFAKIGSALAEQTGRNL